MNSQHSSTEDRAEAIDYIDNRCSQAWAALRIIVIAVLVFLNWFSLSAGLIDFLSLRHIALVLGICIQGCGTYQALIHRITVHSVRKLITIVTQIFWNISIFSCVYSFVLKFPYPSYDAKLVFCGFSHYQIRLFSLIFPSMIALIEMGVKKIRFQKNDFCWTLVVALPMLGIEARQSMETIALLTEYDIVKICAIATLAVLLLYCIHLVGDHFTQAKSFSALLRANINKLKQTAGELLKERTSLAEKKLAAEPEEKSDQNYT